MRVAEVKKEKGIRSLEHIDDAFNSTFVGFFRKSCAYPTERLCGIYFGRAGGVLRGWHSHVQVFFREGAQTSFSPMLNFVVRFLSLYAYLRMTTPTPVLNLFIYLHENALRSRSKMMSTRSHWSRSHGRESQEFISRIC
jgi:hypothetical protein